MLTYLFLDLDFLHFENHGFPVVVHLGHPMLRFQIAIFCQFTNMKCGPSDDRTGLTARGAQMQEL